MKMIDWILDNFPEEEILIADGFDDAIIGLTQTDHVVVYSINKCIDILIAQDMTREDAIEYFDYNVSGAYVGEKTPIWIYTPDNLKEYEV